ncbi:hypothetical protein ACIHFE_34210 [Streptomyces sp. NPDC052396]|uniref:hypothetical protein n=1 Tax=Streptomyces sp. NPDC052396 TaxID=3365689 RepID=UPI0037D280CA
MVSYHPAGRDTALYAAVQDVKAGHWMQMRQVLAQTGTWREWTARTQVLGVAAARGNVVELWLQEEPQSVAARVMYARVTTERALDAHRSRASAEDPRRVQQLDELAGRARQACRRADELTPGDPVAPICLLALAETDTAGRFPEHCVAPPPPDFLLPHGPWGLLEAAHRRDGFNREAWHRMFRVLQVGPGSVYLSRRAVAMDFARWSVSTAPLGSPLLLLPLYAHVEEYRARRSRGDIMLGLWWTNESITPAIAKAFEGWFCRCDPEAGSTTDLNYLAHALSAGGFLKEAAAVFQAIGDFATPAPWQYISHDADRWWEEFEAAHSACLRRLKSPPSTGRRP